MSKNVGEILDDLIEACNNQNYLSVRAKVSDQFIDFIKFQFSREYDRYIKEHEENYISIINLLKSK